MGQLNKLVTFLNKKHQWSARWKILVRDGSAKNYVGKSWWKDTSEQRMAVDLPSSRRWITWITESGKLPQITGDPISTEGTEKEKERAEREREVDWWGQCEKIKTGQHQPSSSAHSSEPPVGRVCPGLGEGLGLGGGSHSLSAGCCSPFLRRAGSQNAPLGPPLGTLLPSPAPSLHRKTKKRSFRRPGENQDDILENIYINPAVCISEE